MIFTDRTITVRKGESRIDEPIVVYRGDYELKVRFTIINSKFRFMSGTNLIESEKASYGQLAILTPYGGNIFSDIVRCDDGSVTFVLTANMLNQIEEVGLYSFQIRLMDYTKESRVSIPPIEFGIEVREPIASEDHDNSVNNAIVGYSIAKVVDPKEENVGDTFDGGGNYNRTKWETGDRISEGKLNKIEDAIDKVNRNETGNTAALSKRIDNNFNILDAVKADKNEIFTMANMGQDIKEAMTGGSVAVVGKNAILTENIVDGQVTSDKLNDGSVTPDKLAESIYEVIDDRIFNGYSVEQTIYNSQEEVTHVSGTAMYYLLSRTVIPKNNTLSYIWVNAKSDITIVLCNRVKNEYIPFSIRTYSTSEIKKGVVMNVYANDDIFIIIGGEFMYTKTPTSTEGLKIGEFRDVQIDTIKEGEPATVVEERYIALFDMEVRMKSICSKTKNALDDMSNRLELLEGQLGGNDIEVVDSYNYEADVFNSSSLKSWGGILRKAYPEGHMVNLTSKVSSGFTVGLATFDGAYFTPYATYIMGEELPEFIPVKSNTYIMIYGTIGYNKEITSVNPCNFYDILDASDLTVGTPYGYKESSSRVGFDISFEIVSRKPTVLESIQSDIEHLKEHMNNSSSSGMEKIHAMEHQITSLIHAVEENIPEAGNEPKVLENQLLQVWDNDLSQEHKHWNMGNSNGSCVSNGFTATAACWYVYDQYLTFDTFRQKAIVTVNDASSVFGLVCKHTQKGAIYLVHGDTNTITLHGQYTGNSTIPTVKATTQLPFTITAGKKYLLDVFKTGWKHNFTITDMETMVSASVMFDNSTQAKSGSYCGKGWGGPGVIIMSGDVVFHNHRYYVSNYKTPRVMFIGDSITEGTHMGAGADIKYRWCSLLRSQYFGYDALICGRGGATSEDILQRMNAFETLDIKPDIVIILDGTNERYASGLSGWKTHMPLIVSKIESWGAKPIICVPPVSSSGFAYIAEMRDFILAQGWNTIRMDIATSLNHDGQTYDSSLYTDGVHPNIKGSQQMFERAVQDLNIIL